MVDIITKRNEALKQSLIDEFINNHDKLKLDVVKSDMSSTDKYDLIFKFKVDGFPRDKTLFYVKIGSRIRKGEEYIFFQNVDYTIYLNSTITDPLNVGYDFALDSYRPRIKNGFPTKEETWSINKAKSSIEQLRQIVVGYINEHIKTIYAAKLDQVNKKFLETQKTLSKIKDKIQKRKDPVDIQMYQQTFEQFQANLIEFETFLNTLKQK